jgi:hypothetical protein
MPHLPGRFPLTGADVPVHAFIAACQRVQSPARGAALVAAVLLLSACPDVKPPKDPRYIPHPKIEQTEESNMKKPSKPNRNSATGDDLNAPAGAQAGRQIGRQGQRASRQDPSMNPRTLADGQWREASEKPKDKSSGG